MTSIWPVVWHDEIDSTNDEAKRLASSGTFNDHWIAARWQTKGRGRLNRSWASVHGNLYTTALYSEPGGLAVATRIPFAAALAVCDVCRQFAGSDDILLKWPNDVRWKGRKLSGILIEAGLQTHGAWVAAGIGINVARTPDDAGQAAVSLADIKGADIFKAEDVLEALRTAFQHRLNTARQDFPALLSDWRGVAEGLGKQVEVKTPEGIVSGILEDLAEDGAIILRLPDGASRLIRAGDVSLIGVSN